jgi:hypothetical protein
MEAMPETLNAAIATEPAWLRAWVLVLVGTHLAAIAFLVHRTGSRWALRMEPIAVLVSFLAAVLLMNWLYEQVGYVRLLGLAHLACWTPAYVWVLGRRRNIGTTSWFGRWVHLYLIVAGFSLLIDTIDVARYLLGDAALLHRWS